MNGPTAAEMAENCEAAANRLAASEREGDQQDAAALRAAAAIHRKTADADRRRAEEEAERERAEEEARPAYWWQDRD